MIPAIPHICEPFRLTATIPLGERGCGGNATGGTAALQCRFGHIWPVEGGRAVPGADEAALDGGVATHPLWTHAAGAEPEAAVGQRLERRCLTPVQRDRASVAGADPKRRRPGVVRA